MKKKAYGFPNLAALLPIPFRGYCGLSSRFASKMFRIMRLLTFFLFVGFLTVQASGVSQTVTLSGKDLSLETIFSTIEKQTGFFVLTNQELLVNAKPVTLSVSNMPLEEFLALTLRDQLLTFRLAGKTIFLSRKPFPVEPPHQPANDYLLPPPVSFLVLDPDGKPLPGATITSISSKKNTALGITDAEGRLSLNVSSGDRLLISFIGFEPFLVRVTDEMLKAGFFSLKLNIAVNNLEEVVAVGYGTSTKKRLSTAVSSLKAEDIAEFPISNIGEALAGKISGVIADNGTGAPGGQPVIRIRGYGSIYAGSEPLYVVDGMLTTSDQFATLNPKSILKIDILKDAAAGAIYGSRAGNGVIIVTTKSGNPGRAQVSVNTTFGVQQLEKKVDVLNRDEWLEYAKEAYTNDNLPVPDFYLKDPSTYANTDWQDEIYRLSSYQNHQVAINGGTDKIKYYVSANYLGDEGIMKTTYNNNLSLNGNFELKVKSNLTVGTTFNTARITQRTNQAIPGFGHTANGYGVAGGIVQQALWTPPIIPVYTSTGDYGQLMQGEFVAPYFTQGYDNPVAGLNEVYDVYNNNNIMSRTYFTYKPVKGLSFTASYSWSLYSRYREYHTSPYLAGNGSPYANFSSPKYDKMTAGQENYMAPSWTADVYADYEPLLNNNHSLKISIGGSLQENNLRSTSASSSVNDRGTANALNPIPAFSNYFRPNIYGAALVLGGGAYGRNKFESIFSRVNYSYRGKYILMASIRRDGSSKFAPNERFGVFPAISGAWRLSQEPFLKGSGLLNELKLRASYGLSGNDQFGDFQWNGNVGYSDIYTYGPVSEGGAGATMVLAPLTIENQNLKWEVNEQANIGLDFSGFDQRVSLTLDYFIRNTNDMLLYRDLPLENGIATRIFDNLGNMTNKGIEVSLNTINIKTKDLQWTTNFIFSKINNRVKSVFTSSGYVSMGWNGMIRIMENRPMFEIYGYKVIGNYTDANQLTTIPGLNNPRVGDPIVEDYKKDNIINGDDWQPLGHALPDFTYGFSSVLKYKNFALQLILNGSYGASVVVSALRQATLLYYASNVFTPYYEQRYIDGVQSGSGVAFPSKSVTGPRHMETSRLVYDASYMRIKNLLIGYNIPQKLCQSIGIDELKVTLGVQNLYTFTHYPLYNPQANTARGAAGNAQFGWDEGVYPLARIYTLGLNLNF